MDTPAPAADRTHRSTAARRRDPPQRLPAGRRPRPDGHASPSPCSCSPPASAADGDRGPQPRARARSCSTAPWPCSPPRSTHPARSCVDATLGLGGHSAALLERFGTLRLVGLDRDPQALALAGRPAGAVRRPRHPRARGLRRARRGARRGSGVGRVQGVLFDLGVSSMQLDEADRGFAYAQDAPLDMRMDQSRGTTAADVVNTYPAAELARVLREYGEERFARRIADAVVRERDREPFTATARLAELVRAADPGGHPAHRRPPGQAHLPGAADRGQRRARRPGSARCPRPSTRSPSAAGSWCCPTTRWRTGSSSGRSSPAPTSTAPPDLPVVPPEHQPVLRLLTRGAETASDDGGRREPAGRLGPAAGRRAPPGRRMSRSAIGHRDRDAASGRPASRGRPAARPRRGCCSSRRCAPARRARRSWSCSAHCSRRARRSAVPAHRPGGGLLPAARPEGPLRGPHRPRAGPRAGGRAGGLPEAAGGEGGGAGHGAQREPRVHPALRRPGAGPAQGRGGPAAPAGPEAQPQLQSPPRPSPTAGDRRQLPPRPARPPRRAGDRSVTTPRHPRRPADPRRRPAQASRPRPSPPTRRPQTRHRPPPPRPAAPAAAGRLRPAAARRRRRARLRPVAVRRPAGPAAGAGRPDVRGRGRAGPPAHRHAARRPRHHHRPQRDRAGHHGGRRERHRRPDQGGRPGGDRGGAGAGAAAWTPPCCARSSPATRASSTWPRP